MKKCKHKWLKTEWYRKTKDWFLWSYDEKEIGGEVYTCEKCGKQIGHTVE